MKKSLDKLQHQPVPKPHAPAAGSQVIKNLQDQLSLTQKQLEETVEELTKAKNIHAVDTIHIGELRAKLDEVTASNRKKNEEIGWLNTEIDGLKEKNVKLTAELNGLQSEIGNLVVTNIELARRANEVKTLPPSRFTVAFNLDSAMDMLQRAKFPVAKWKALSFELNPVSTVHVSFDNPLFNFGDGSKLHALIEYWINSIKYSDPWSVLVEAVDRIGEHDVAAELATAVGVQHTGNIMVMLHF